MKKLLFILISFSFLVAETVFEKKQEAVYQRNMRQTESLLNNPANLGIDFDQAAMLNLFLPPFDLGIGANASFFELGFLEDYFVKGKTLNDEEKQELVDHFEGSDLGITTDFSFNILGVRVGRIFFNNQVLVKGTTLLPEQFLSLPLKGFQFDQDDIVDETIQLDAYIVDKTTISYGHPLSFGRLGTLRVGAGLNYYLGGFSFAHVEGFNLDSEKSGINTGALAKVAMPSIDSVDADNLPIANGMGLDLGVGFRLGEVFNLPVLSYLNERLDAEISLLNIGGTLSADAMDYYEYSIEGQYDTVYDLVQAIDNGDVDYEEIAAESNTTVEARLAPELRIKLTAQPLASFYVSTGMNATMGSDNLGYFPGADYFLNVDFFPLRILGIGMGIAGVNDSLRLDGRLSVTGKRYEMLFEASAYGIGGTLSGAELSLNQAWYFGSK